MQEEEVKRFVQNKYNITKKHTITFTEASNAIDYLEKAYYFLGLTKQSPINWKWVVLALHGALYGFAICALKGVNIYPASGGPFTKKDLDDSDALYMRKGKLMTLDDALKKCQRPNIMGAYEGSRALSLVGSQKKSISKLKKGLRNNFEHFTPKIWLISTEDLPHISADVLDVISFLAIGTQANIHVLAESQKINKLIGDCKLILKKQSHSATPYPVAHHLSLD